MTSPVKHVTRAPHAGTSGGTNVLRSKSCQRIVERDRSQTPVHCGATKKKSLEVDEVNKDKDTVCTSNLPPPPEDPEEPDAFIQWGPLIFDPLPPLAEDEDAPLTAANNQAEMMRWHYRLGNLTFPKLKQLALNGKIPKILAKLTPPKCTGCLFGAMTKLPWRGKESKSSHEVFVATKPGETVSINQMTSSEVGSNNNVVLFVQRMRVIF